MDSQTLLSQSACYVCIGVSEQDALGLGLLATIAQNGIAPPAPGDIITTDALIPITSGGVNVTTG